MRIASIDIGTNTARCLVSEVEGGFLKPVRIYREIVRTGSGIRTEGSLRSEPIRKLLEILNAFGSSVRQYGCQRMWAVATSAFREAGSRGDLVGEAMQALSFPISIISGEEEAALTAAGVQAGIGEMNDGIIVDIGGGSTEIVRVSGGVVRWWSSLQEGVVHLTEELLKDDPPTRSQVESLKERFRSLLMTEKDDGGTEFAGTAGTPTTLAALELGIDVYDPTLVNGHVLSRQTISSLRGEFLKVDAAGRLVMPGMEKGREDLIVAGVLMVEEIMERWGYDTLKVSDWGLLEGVALAAAEGKGTEIG